MTRQSEYHLSESGQALLNALAEEYKEKVIAKAYSSNSNSILDAIDIIEAVRELDTDDRVGGYITKLRSESVDRGRLSYLVSVIALLTAFMVFFQLYLLNNDNGLFSAKMAFFILIPAFMSLMLVFINYYGYSKSRRDREYDNLQSVVSEEKLYQQDKYLSILDMWSDLERAVLERAAIDFGESELRKGSAHLLKRFSESHKIKFHDYAQVKDLGYVRNEIAHGNMAGISLQDSDMINFRKAVSNIIRDLKRG